MFKFFFGFIFSIMGIILVSFPSLSEDEEEKEDELYTVYYLSYDCESSPISETAGSSSENPLKVSLEKIRENPKNFDCLWVKVRGYFSVSDYYHYKGLLFGSIFDYYKGDFYLYVEDFGDLKTSKFELNGADFELTGQIIDLCKHAADYTADIKVLFLFGPCHYGDSYTLKSVVVNQQLSPPHQAPPPELLADLYKAVAVPKDWENYKEAEAATNAWIDLVINKGFVAYAKEFEFDELDYQTLDMKDNWISYFFTAENSPLLWLKKDNNKENWKMFASEGDLNKEGFSGLDEVYSCFCLEEDCQGKWPEYVYQIAQFSPSLICIEITQWDKDSEWEWNWF